METLTLHFILFRSGCSFFGCTYELVDEGESQKEQTSFANLLIKSTGEDFVLGKSSLPHRGDVTECGRSPTWAWG